MQPGWQTMQIARFWASPGRQQREAKSHTAELPPHPPPPPRPPIARGLQPEGLRGQSKERGQSPQARGAGNGGGVHLLLSRNHTCGLPGWGWGWTPLLISEPFTGAVRGNNKAVSELSKEVSCQDIKAEKDAFNFAGLVTELLTDSASVHQG